MDSSNLVQLINKCKDSECIKTVLQNYIIYQIFIGLFTGIFICLGLFILCKYFMKYFE